MEKTNPQCGKKGTKVRGVELVSQGCILPLELWVWSALWGVSGQSFMAVTIGKPPTY